MIVGIRAEIGLLGGAGWNRPVLRARIQTWIRTPASVDSGSEALEFVFL
jgi:hypothetical protein